MLGAPPDHPAAHSCSLQRAANLTGWPTVSMDQGNVMENCETQVVFTQPDRANLRSNLALA